jgi:hypothetical protein
MNITSEKQTLNYYVKKVKQGNLKGNDIKI